MSKDKIKGVLNMADFFRSRLKPSVKQFLKFFDRLTKTPALTSSKLRA